ncbi:MAG: CDP-glucose 4,6-dehydratase [Syntrophotalea acetylenica]|jgi:CDP-glucose 4,6-dehydratase|nr:CDP-glucose 4,6-dehydratase [Syntrophotalea acetylenica]
MFDGFYRGKRIFVTGHTGFKGAWLCLWLKNMGAEIGVFSLEPPSEPSLWELAGVEDDVCRLGGDIRDARALAEAICDFKPEIVIHMAAQSLVRPSYEAPLDTFSTNVMGTANLLEGVRLAGGVRAVINVTSDKCYDNREQNNGFIETDPMGGHDPYSASKGCAELVCQSYRKCFFAEGLTAVASVRAGNVIGGGDFAVDRLIPDMVRAFSAGESVRIRAPHATRPWQHVLEPLAGYLMLAQKLVEEGREFEGGWNFGPADESARTVGEVVTTFSTVWGDGAKHVLDSSEHPHEATWLKLDCTKANSVLGWVPRTDFSKAIEMTASWYKAWAKGIDSRAVTMEQIAEFEEM